MNVLPSLTLIQILHHAPPLVWEGGGGYAPWDTPVVGDAGPSLGTAPDYVSSERLSQPGLRTEGTLPFWHLGRYLLGL